MRLAMEIDPPRVQRIDRGTGAEDTVTLGEACAKVASYFDCSPGKALQALKRGETLQTIAYVYRLQP